MPVVTEVMDPRQVELVERYADMFQIGARNMQNFDLLKEVGQTRKPVLLKRGMSATVKDLLMSAEYILAEGNPNVVLCERGVRSFEDSTRNMLDLSARAERQGAEPSADHRRSQPRHRPARPDPVDGPGGRRRGRRRRAHRSPLAARRRPCPTARRRCCRTSTPSSWTTCGNWPTCWARRSMSVKEKRFHAHPADRRQLEDEPVSTEASVALAEGVKTGLGPATDVHVADLPPVRLPRPVARCWKARRSGWARRTCSGKRRGRSPARSPRCSSTSAAPTSSSATASGGTAWARPMATSTRSSRPPSRPG